MATATQPTTSQNGHSTGNTIPVENPATGEIVAHVPDMSAEEVAGLVERARAAQPAWEALGFEGRKTVMLEARKWLIQNRRRMIETVVEESGKTFEDAQLAEVFFCADSLGFWGKTAEKYLADEKVKTHTPLLLGKKLIQRYRPRGVIGVIGPWNYPLTNNFGDCIPALMAGNTVVLKPSEVTPLTSLLMAEGMRAAGCPEDVFLVATGRGESGAALIDSADFVMFTGSVATGRKVAAKAAESLTPFTLELGGKDPMIVLRDADLERAANTAVYWSMANGGQICQAVERVYVEEPIYDEFVSKVVEKTQALRQGAPRRDGCRRRRRRHVRKPGRDHRGPRQRRGRKGGEGPHRWETPRGGWPLLGAHRPRGRRPLDEDHDRGDIRPDAADHEGARRGGGGREGERLALRPQLERLHQGRREGRADRAPHRGGLDLRKRLHHELHSTGTALRRREGVGNRRTSFGRRDPEVLQYTRDPDHPLRGQARAVLLPVFQAWDQAARAPDGAYVRAGREEALTSCSP
jgi:hypothetical protein